MIASGRRVTLRCVQEVTEREAVAFFSDECMDGLGLSGLVLKCVSVDYVYVDRLNPRSGVWPALQALLDEHFPHLTGRYRRILFNERARKEYSWELRATLDRVSRRLGLKGRMEFCC